MSDFRTNDVYEPNEPRPLAGGYTEKPLSPAQPLMNNKDIPSNMPADHRRVTPTGVDTWAQPTQPGRAYAQRTWDEEDYLPNEEPAKTANVANDTRKTAASPLMHETYTSPATPVRKENPYSRATWDETDFVTEASDRKIGTRPAKAAAPLKPDDVEIYRQQTNDTATASAERRKANPYARPATDQLDGVSDVSARFAPPLKFELPQTIREDVGEPYTAAPPNTPNVYQTRKSAYHSEDEVAFDPMLRADAYRVEADGRTPAQVRHRKRVARRLIVVILLLVALALAAYFERGWILEQLKPLLGEETIASVNQSMNQAAGTAQTKLTGYDPAPVLQIGDLASQGISAVAGHVTMDPYIVTNSNVVTRVQTGDGQYDYYLFSAKDGMLLGYYEGLGANDFLVCPNDVYYVAESPYLIDSSGKPLIAAAYYQQRIGANAVLTPMINGWSIISDAAGTSFNYIDADGKLISTLWFAKVYPFTGSSTLAYVDTGNVTDPQERYTLYEIDRAGGMKMWKHTADMEDVLGCAANMACLSTGELILLDGHQTVLCTSDDVAMYVDCGAVVARDATTQKYALFVNGEQLYDFDYDRIAPVSSDIRWAQHTQGLYTQYTVTDLPYPLPLSHYFALQKGETQELVALSTASVYPMLTDEQR